MSWDSTTYKLVICSLRLHWTLCVRKYTPQDANIVVLAQDGGFIPAVGSIDQIEGLLDEGLPVLIRDSR